MPDPVLYSQAMAVAAIVSALCVLTIGRLLSATETSARVNLALTLSLGAGMLAGYRILHLRFAWPPVNGLDRLLTIVLPLAFVVEFLTACQRRQPWIAVALRVVLAASVGRILLQGSVYLGGPRSSWTTMAALALVLLSGVTLAMVWWLLDRLSVRSPDSSSIPLALALSSQTTAITVMLAGYVTGGAASLPLTAALFGTAAASKRFRVYSAQCGVIGVGTVGLFGLLFVGRFFGGLTTLQALTIFLAPLLCWVTEIPLLKPLSVWKSTIIRLGLVSIPLLIVVVLAKQTFDRETAPLVSFVNISSNAGGR